MAWSSALSAVSSGLILVFAFPHYDLTWFAWIALVPLLRTLHGKGTGRSFGLAFLAGLVFFGIELAGIGHQSVNALKWPHFTIVGLALALYWGAWAAITQWLSRHLRLSHYVFAPTVWLAIEFLRSNLSFLAFPWLLLGHTQYLHPSLLQLASITGVYGISFLVISSNAAIAAALSSPLSHAHPRKRRAVVQSFLPVLIVAVAISAVAFWGATRMTVQEHERTELDVAVIQNYVPHGARSQPGGPTKVLDDYVDLMQKVVNRHPTVIVWPESAVPADVLHDMRVHSRLAGIARKAKTFLLVGGSEEKLINQRIGGRYFNTMVLFNADGEVNGVYRKTRLVPFAEYIPLPKLVRWPAFLAPSVRESVAGTELTLFQAAGVPFGTLICWEALFPEMSRDMVKHGARYLISATNEVWFGQSDALRQLFAMAIFRAVENKVPVVRAANGGVSAIVDPFGRVLDIVQRDGRQIGVEGTLVSRISIGPAGTFYTRYGDVFAFVHVVISLGLAGVVLIKVFCRHLPFLKLACGKG
jgi:apolipoprotein N-acyltransferase